MQAATEPKVVFFHILKTGGMTFRGMLERMYGDRFHVCENPDPAAIQADLTKFAAVEFHTLPWNNDFVHVHRDLIAESRWNMLKGHHNFVMFREPVSQCISQYYDVVR